MALNKILAIAFFIAIIKKSSGTSHCDIETSSYSCIYRVVCRVHPGSASNPPCGDEPNVTFVMTSSVSNVVTTGFFGATNFDSRVRAIEAANNTWLMLAPLAFRYYSKVNRIDFSNNFIHEIQDEAFKTLTLLNHLNLSNNMILELKPKSLLITDSKITDLETLDLSNNILTSISDEVLSHLPNLITLNLQGNKLKTLSDYCFGSQRHLISLQLQNNEVERLNMSLINLKKLKNLDLSFNRLKTISGYEINRLEKLEKINISNNGLASIESNCFRQSPYLKVVDLSYNLISSAIETFMFGANNMLEYLNLYSNRITTIEVNSFNNNNELTYFNVTSNNISGEIKNYTFTGLVNILKVDLSRQNITIIKSNAFGSMKNLLHLNLSRNQISDIESLSDYDCSINVVDVSYNRISELNFLNAALINLTEIYLNNNNISILHKNTFKDQRLVEKLDLSSNNIILIEDTSLPLQNLQYLNLINNPLTGVFKQNMISPAGSLRFLDLSNFNISKIENLTFVDMPVLARLNLSNNNIEEVEPDNFIRMDNLYSIDVSYNNLKEFEFNNSLLTNLKAAYLNNNKLTNVSRIFPRTCNLLYLEMSHNGFSDLSYVDSKLFPELQTLHLSHNNIEHFNNPHTNTLSKLLDLRLSSNKIRDIDLSYHEQLMIIDLSDNYLSDINNTFFKNINFVQSIDLSRNNISDLPPGVFQTMKNLKMLNLSSNHIWKLRYGSLKGLHKTELLDVSNNKIDSLDVNVFYECTELKTLIIDYNRIKTLDIERLVLVTQRKLKTLSLGGNPISCQEIIRNATLKDLSFYGLNQIVVTSIHKIYHEDNVHGIKCGDDDVTTTVKIEEKVKMADTETSTYVITVVWCSILTIVLVTIGIVAYVRFRVKRDDIVFYRDSRPLRNSLEFDGTEYDVIQ